MKQIETLSIIMSKNENNIKFLVHDNTILFGRLVGKEETLIDSVMLSFEKLGLDVSEINPVKIKEEDKPGENFKVYYLLESDYFSLLGFVDENRGFNLGITEDKIIEDIKKKIEGNL